MQDRWFLEPGGSRTGPHSLGQLQAMASSGQLRPTDLVLKEGADVPIAAGAVPGLFAAAAADKGPGNKWPAGRRWALVGAGGAAALVGVALLVHYLSGGAPRPNPNLPEWFDPAYRIGKNRGIIFPPGVVKRQGKGYARPGEAATGGKYTEEWLDKHFTHYIDWQNAFIWSTPRVRYPSDGKIIAGVKVIVGEQVNELSLICTRTEDGRPENMYVETVRLRARSKGPPPEDKGD
jgi:hypothetical protein